MCTITINIYVLGVRMALGEWRNRDFAQYKEI